MKLLANVIFAAMVMLLGSSMVVAVVSILRAVE